MKTIDDPMDELLIDQIFLIYNTLKSIKYKDWQFIFDDKKFTIKVVIGDTGWKGRAWLISRYSTRSEIVQTCLKAVLTAEEHEAREEFKYRGSAIFAPHFDVDDMVNRLIKMDIRS